MHAVYKILLTIQGYVFHAALIAYFLAIAFFKYRLRVRKTAQPPAEDHDGIDIWHGFLHKVPRMLYGKGSPKDFSVFLSGSSRVRVRNVDDICAWLLECKYISDLAHFYTRDHWQHPMDLERTRQGDCEDTALWAWRKLADLKINAEFMVGMWLREGRQGAHAWVVFHDEKGTAFLLETVLKDRAAMVRPLEQVKNNYIPFASVDHELKRRAYMGLLYWKRKLERGQNDAKRKAG